MLEKNLAFHLNICRNNQLFNVELTFFSLCLIGVLFLIYSIYFLQSVPALSFNSLGTISG